MTVSVWRISVESTNFAANDLTGKGARISGGRWNNVGVPMVYSSMSIALALLETLHYLHSGALPFNRYLVRINIPDAIWNTRRELAPLPGGWDAVPSGMVGRLAGDAWAGSLDSALLMVPSVIVPDEQNVLINPRHIDAAAITATTLKRWIYDPRFFTSSP